MQITYEDGKFIANISFEQRFVFKQNKWIFDGQLKQWVTTNPKLVLPFKDFTVGAARDRVYDFLKEETAKVAESLAVDADIDIPVPDGINPDTGKPFAALGFQKGGVAYAAKRKITLLADQPGLGKTIQAILLSNYIEDARKIFVLCPAFMKLYWQRTWRNWDTKNLSVGICGSKQRTKTVKGVTTRWIDRVWPETDVRIINPEQLPMFYPLTDIEWDLLIIDESDMYSNAKTIRSKYVYGGTIKEKEKRDDDQDEKNSEDWKA